MSFRLAHFSDVHLGPVTASDIFGAFHLKRLIGGMSWYARRKALHRNDVAAALRSDLKSAAVDHIACTGDLVNIAAPGEFVRGLAWLKGVGDPSAVSLVPGNHDAYVKTAPLASIDMFREYMSGDGQEVDIKWPFVRLKRNIAMLGVSTAQPQNLFRAGGTVGEHQRNALAARLADLGARGFFRVVFIHHPPLPGLAKARKALTDAAALQTVFEQSGVELVLHGHNHKAMFNTLKTSSGLAHIVGVPSASMVDEPGHESAQWHCYEISRTKGQWQTKFASRRWDGVQKRFLDGPSRILGEGQ